MPPNRPDTRLEGLVDPEWIEWYAMSLMQRWEASGRLWSEYLAMGGSLDPEVDMQSPFWSVEELSAFARNMTAFRQDREAAARRSAGSSAGEGSSGSGLRPRLESGEDA